MDEPIRWPLEWGCAGALTALLAPTIMPLTGEVSWLYSLVAALLGGVTGGAVGGFAEHLHRRLPPRSRVVTMWLLLPVPLGAWGAAVASIAALLCAPSFTIPAFFAGSFVAMAQMGWFVPLYTSAVSAHSALRVMVVAGSALSAAPLGAASLFVVGMGAGLLNEL